MNQIDHMRAKLLAFMQPDVVYALTELQIALGSYSAKRVVMYLLFDGELIRTANNKFLRPK